MDLLSSDWTYISSLLLNTLGADLLASRETEDKGKLAYRELRSVAHDGLDTYLDASVITDVALLASEVVDDLRSWAKRANQ